METTTTYHVTRIANGGVYGHETKCCDETADDVTVGHVYEIADDDGRVVAEAEEVNDVKFLCDEVAALVGHDGTEVLRTIVECALDDDPNATAEDIAEIVREARRDAAIERARGSENRGDA